MAGHTLGCTKSGSGLRSWFTVVDARLSVTSLILPKSTRTELHGKTLHRAPPQPITAPATADLPNCPPSSQTTELIILRSRPTSRHHDSIGGNLGRDRLTRTMASLRTQSAARMLRAAATPASRIAPRRWQSTATSAPAAVPAPTTTNQPDYDIQADKATSYVHQRHPGEKWEILY